MEWPSQVIISLPPDHNDNQMVWTGLVCLLNITRCKSKSDPAVIRPLRLRARIHHLSQQEQDVDILNTLTLTTIGSGWFSSALLILDLMLIFNNNICIKACILTESIWKVETNFKQLTCVSSSLICGQGEAASQIALIEMRWQLEEKCILCIEILSSNIQQATSHLLGDKSITAELKVSIFNLFIFQIFFDKVANPCPVPTSVSNMKNYSILVQIKTFYLTSNIINIIKIPITAWCRWATVTSNKL